MNTCIICSKHKGEEPIPPGGYIYEDRHWMVCHAPVNAGPLGTLFIESRRHFLHYAEMTEAEAVSLGGVLKKVFAALQLLLQPERIYQLSTMEGVPHFHCWIVPRGKDVTERGLKFLARDDLCEEKDAGALAEKLHEALK